MTRPEARELADSIAADHGCELIPAGKGGTALVVRPAYQQGSLLDDRRLAACRAALDAAKLAPRNLVS